MKLVLPRFYKSLKYDVIPQKFEGKLEYVADFDCGEYAPYAVWRNYEPNREKKHKDFMMISVIEGSLWVMGMDRADIEPYLTRSAIHCHVCDEVVYSMYRHDYVPCSCENVAIDGGSDYTRIAFKGEKYTTGTLNLETKQFTKVKEP